MLILHPSLEEMLAMHLRWLTRPSPHPACAAMTLYQWSASVIEVWGELNFRSHHTGNTSSSLHYSLY